MFLTESPPNVSPPTGSSTTLPGPNAAGASPSQGPATSAVSELPVRAHFNGHREDLGRSRKLRRGMTAAQLEAAKGETWDMRIMGAYMRAEARS